MNSPTPPILAVLDIKHGQAVHAVAGKRASYRPLPNNLVTHPAPLELAKRYLQQGIQGLYVADLDAIQGGPLQTATLQPLLNLGVPLWLDAGIVDQRDWLLKHPLLADPHHVIDWIVASETFRDSSPNLSPAPWIRDALNDTKMTFGIDFFSGSIRTAVPQPAPPNLFLWVEQLIATGFDSFLLLDIAVVGTNSGPACGSLCQQMRQRFPSIRLYSGGGIRSPEDLNQLIRSGCDAVLVGSALHRPESARLIVTGDSKRKLT